LLPAVAATVAAASTPTARHFENGRREIHRSAEQRKNDEKQIPN